MTPIELGPADGTVSLHTTRDGLAGRIGHDLTIGVRRWSATFAFDGETATGLDVTLDVDSLEVTEGRGGLKPLSNGDRRTIVDNARKTLQAKLFPQIRFTADRASATGIEGQLSIAGSARSVTVVPMVEKQSHGARVTASVAIRQTDFGIKPYSTMLGQLKVADVVTVRVDVVVPAEPAPS